MALQSIPSWNYYTGANAVVKIDGIDVGEAVAIRYALIQNRTPLYGYNAPLFNAVADGQVIVQGSLAVNYITHEYLLAVIRSQVDVVDIIETPDVSVEDLDLLSTVQIENIILSQDEGRKIEALKDKFWGPGPSALRRATNDYNTDLGTSWGRPDQHTRSVDIRVNFGDQLKSNGSTYHILENVFFLGRSMGTAITEDPLIEQFDFIARRII